MKTIKVIIILLTLSLFTFCTKNEDNSFDKESYIKEFNNYSKEYLSTLKGVLVKNMQEGGPIKAVNVCSDTAQVLTEAFSKKHNVLIKRLSLKNRNDNNVPDKYESDAINEFENLLKQDKLNSKSNIIVKKNIDGKSALKFFKPIIVAAPCLNCHGSESEIDNGVKELIKSKYPNDKAINYSIGQLRGVLSLTKNL